MKQVAELKLKLQEMEREKTALDGAFGRSETQLKRFKTIAEQSEKESEELQKQNRQLKKEVFYNFIILRTIRKKFRKSQSAKNFADCPQKFADCPQKIFFRNFC